jgi:ankyrin repeat protein
MGAAASVANAGGDGGGTTEVVLKRLPDAVEESVYVHEKFPIVIDKSEHASRFFKYQTGAYISMEDPIASTKSSLNRALVSSFLNGRTMTLRFATLEGVTESIFDPQNFPIEVIDRRNFFREEIWQKLLKPSDPPIEEAQISSEFAFIICTASDFVPDYLKNYMHIIKVVDPSNDASGNARSGSILSSGDAGMDQIASIFGASEIIRNSVPLVEAAFDGELEEVIAQIEKGYHLESVDGRKHTALSEAACQGHLHVVEYLLQHGADPNNLADNGRSPIWRAAFNGHLPVVEMLLEAGANPEYRDRVSMESAFDIASTDDVRALLANWDLSKTQRLMEERRRIMLEQLESRIKTSAEREAFARNLLRKELVEKAEAGDIHGINELLTMIVGEAKEQQKRHGNDAPLRPRASVEVRNDLGQSLLSIAAQRDDVSLATWLLKHWKSIDEDRWDLTEGEVSPEAKVFKPNVNSRDLKGWTCCAIAVFHDSRKVLRLLLEHGADPNIRSSYNKNAWDLAKDELDAAEKVVKSRVEVREVLLEFDRNGGHGPALFARAEIVKTGDALKGDIYDGLDTDGSAMVMNVEMNDSLAVDAEAQDANQKKKKSSFGGNQPKGGTKGSGGKSKAKK